MNSDAVFLSTTFLLLLVPTLCWLVGWAVFVGAVSWALRNWGDTVSDRQSGPDASAANTQSPPQGAGLWQPESGEVHEVEPSTIGG